MKISKDYNHKIVESSIQKHWEKNNTFKVYEDNKKEKYYCLSMMPYPSGNLHIGHVRNYTIGDVISRYHRMLGKNVLNPIGWDAFGLPAENAAIKSGILPSEWTYSNINSMRKQMKSLGFSYDWSREIITCLPQYYRWEQYFFIYLYKKKLAYKKNSLVNWCPKDNTVLANEQVIDGSCWRCNSKVYKKLISQWFLKITSYAEELFNNINYLLEWPEKVKNMQKKWIGKSSGIDIELSISNQRNKIKVHINRPDKIMKFTHLLISVNHKLALEESKNNFILLNFIKRFRKNFKLSKNLLEGVNTKLHVINPLNKSLLPIWVVNFLPNEYNQESILVNNNDPSYLEFFERYNLISKNLKNNNGNLRDISLKEKSEFFIDKLINLGGKKRVFYRLKDWVISRQRYWGVPIPMIITNDNQIIPVKKNDLPLVLPENINIKNFSDPFKSYVNQIKTFKINNKFLTYENDTFDTFMESSWYYARYTCVNYDKNILDIKKTNYWLPIDQYIGGIEHATMHLIYFRFYHKLLRDAGFVNSDEPVKRLLCQGMVLSDAFYYISETKEKIWISPLKVNVKRDNKGNIIKAREKNTKRELIYYGLTKMSKSKNNGIDPNKIIEKYGADTLRLFIMFAAPASKSLEWKEIGIIGAKRFLNRLWKLTYNHILESKNIKKIKINISKINSIQRDMYENMNKVIKKVTDDIDRRQNFNTAISSIMQLTNKIYKWDTSYSDLDHNIKHEILSNILKMLYPFTPHICFILWKFLNDKEKDIDYISWPTVKNNLHFKKEKVSILVQINGKFRGIIYSHENSKKKIILEKIKNDNKIYRFINKRNIFKIIYIKNKIINILLK